MPKSTAMAIWNIVATSGLFLKLLKFNGVRLIAFGSITSLSVAVVVEFTEESDNCEDVTAGFIAVTNCFDVAAGFPALVVSVDEVIDVFAANCSGAFNSFDAEGSTVFVVDCIDDSFADQKVV